MIRPDGGQFDTSAIQRRLLIRLLKGMRRGCEKFADEIPFLFVENYKFCGMEVCVKMNWSIAQYAVRFFGFNKFD